MNRASVAAGVPPAVEGGVSPPGIPGSWSQCAIRESWGLPMNRASVAAGVPPAVEGGVSPPGIPGSWSQCAIRESWGLPMNLSMAAIARVEPGSLTPTLSRGERVSRPARGDMPVLRPSVPSRLTPANPLLHPSKLAGILLPLPPGEGRGEGRSLLSSRHGSQSVGMSFSVTSPMAESSDHRTQSAFPRRVCPRWRPGQRSVFPTRSRPPSSSRVPACRPSRPCLPPSMSLR
jgi:hypothetical protein